jgi:hypothetical protein
VIRRAIIVAVAAGLGLWVAIAAAQGGLGGGSSGTGTFGGIPCPPGSTVACPVPERHGAGGGVGTGGAGGGEGKTVSSATPTAAGEPQGEKATHHGRRFVGRRLTFTFSVRLPHTAGTAAVHVSGYSAHVSPPLGSSASCQPRLTRLIALTDRDQVARVRVKPPLGGWCGGRYHVTVSLNH